MNLLEFYRVEKEILGIGGWGRRTPAGTCRIIYGLVHTLKPKICFETGTFVGLSTIWILRALYENGIGHLYSTEIMPEYVKITADFIKRIGFNDDSFCIFQEDTTKVLRDGHFHSPVDFFYMDDEPKISYIERLNLMMPKLSPGAYVLAHDTFKDNPFEGAYPFLEYMKTRTDFKVFDIDEEYGLSIMRRI